MIVVVVVELLFIISMALSANKRTLSLQSGFVVIRIVGTGMAA